MKTLIRQVNILSPGSPHSGSVKDVVLENGVIQQISEGGKIKGDFDTVIEGKDKHLCPGWLDLHVNFREPGEEYKEDLQSGCKAAMQGGFTGVLCMPSTKPAVDSGSAVEFILNRTKSELVEVFPSGSLSRRMEGKDLSEMYDMFKAGAKVFTDDKKSVQDAGLMLRALLYVQNFGGKIFSFPNDNTISSTGQMHEGPNSTSLGLKGIPPISEEIMISRDLFLAEYTGAEIHFSCISTGRSVQLIREAKKKGLKVTADVSALHISLNDSELKNFETNYKVLPPLREPDDINALIAGLKDGTIDAICSDHSPEDVENKRKEYELASFGAEGLETAFAAAYTSLRKHLSSEEIISKFSNGPRRILGLEPVIIKEGSVANLTLVDLTNDWTVTESAIHSRSKNNPFLNKPLSGKAVYVFNKNQMHACN